MVKLGDIVNINPRMPKGADEEQVVSFVPMASVSEDGFLQSEENRLLSQTKKGFTYFERGDVLLAKITPCFENGKSLRPNQISHQIGFGSTEFHVLRPDIGSLDSQYLFYLIWSDSFRILGKQSMSGAAGQKRVGGDLLKNYEFPLPSLAEQKRIATILDKADAIRRKRQQAIQLADDFLRAVFLDMFGDPVTNPKGWETAALGDVLKAIDSGSSPVCDSRRAEQNEWGVLKLGAVTYCEFEPSSNKAIIENYVPKLSHEVKVGDLLFSRKNTSELVAAVALVERTRPMLLLPDLIFRLETEPTIDKYFLWKMLCHPGMRKTVQSLASGAAGSMPNISKSNLRTVEIILPPIEMQKMFAKLCAKISTLSLSNSRSTTYLENTTASISRQSFS